MRRFGIFMLAALSGPLAFWGSFFLPSDAQGYDLREAEQPVSLTLPAAAIESPPAPAAAEEEVVVPPPQPLAVPPPVAQPDSAPVPYKQFPLGPGDELTLTVWGYPELSVKGIVILPDGTVSCPLVGSVPAEGLTADELAANLQQALARHIPSPKVTLMLTTMRSRHFSVIGAVKKPGLYPFWNDEMTVLEALAQAEGMLETALPAEVKVFRQGGNGEVADVDVRELLSSDAKAGAFRLQPGDLVYVPSFALQQKVSVLGQVNLPGMYPLEAGMTVVDALSRAGWIPTSGAMDSVIILRRVDEGKPEILRINAHRAIVQRDVSQAPLLQPGDVVYVPEKFFSRIGNFVNSLTAGPESGSRTALRVYDVSNP